MAGRRLRTGSYVVLAAIALSLAVTVVRAQWIGQVFGIVDNTGAQTFTAGNPGRTKAGPLAILSLDVASVTTGGTAVAALAAGHATAGGFLITANAAGICVNEKGTAGTTTTGDTACVATNVPYYIAPTGNAVSVNSSASGVAIAGYGLQ